jgi:hypothetical protein
MWIPKVAQWPIDHCGEKLYSAGRSPMADCESELTNLNEVVRLNTHCAPPAVLRVF